MRLKPPPRKLLQIVRARNQPLTGKHIPPKVLSHLRRNFVLKIARIDRSRARPHMSRNDEVVMNQRNMVVAHSLSHHGRNMRAKRTLQILKLNDRHLRATRRLERRNILERGSTSRRQRNLRTGRNYQDKNQSHNETFHSAIHSSCHPLSTKEPSGRTYRLLLPGAPRPGAGCPIHAVSSHEWAIARTRDPLRLRARLHRLRKKFLSLLCGISVGLLALRQIVANVRGFSPGFQFPGHGINLSAPSSAVPQISGRNRGFNPWGPLSHPRHRIP
jgi:hypothetical protein